jgi:hypothetical protein
VRGLLRRGERRKIAGRGEVKLDGGCSPFIGGRGSAGEFNVGVRWGYDGKSVDNPIFVWVRFGWCMLTTTPACLWKMSPSEGRASRSESGEV